MSDYAFRTVICSVIFLDIVDYSKAAVDRQVQLKDVLNDAIRSGLENAHKEEIIVLDSGDGAAICFFGDPEDALFAATAITNELRGKLLLRAGINLGPVKMVTDLNGNKNVIGDAINTAQRIMSFADINELLISRSYFEVVSCLRDENSFCFLPLGIRKDKHIREHEVYAVAPRTEAAIRIENAIENEEETTSFLEDQTEHIPLEIPDDFRDKCKSQLALSLGPLASFLIRKAEARAKSINDFVSILAENIESKSERQAFVEKFGGEMPAEQSIKAETPNVVEADLSGQIQEWLNDDLIKQAATLLAQTIGPIAKPTVDRTAKKVHSLDEFANSLGKYLEDPDERNSFMEKLKRDGD